MAEVALRCRVPRQLADLPVDPRTSPVRAPAGEVGLAGDPSMDEVLEERIGDGFRRDGLINEEEAGRLHGLGGV